METKLDVKTATSSMIKTITSSKRSRVDTPPMTIQWNPKRWTSPIKMSPSSSSQGMEMSIEHVVVSSDSSRERCGG